MIFNTIFGNKLDEIPQFNKHMRDAHEIMKDYGLEV